MTNSPLIHAYESRVGNGSLYFNEKQYRLVEKLDQYLEGFDGRCLKNQSFLTKIKSFWKTKPLQRGVYLWGSVGTGKTLLLDLFYQHLDTSRKKRLHFHEFMNFLQKETFEKTGKKENKIQEIGTQFLNNYDVLCFDEFYLDHIVEAMLLKPLFEVWLQGGLLLLMTSNVAPGQLYQKGINRELVLPFIKLLESHMDIEELTLTKDFRRNPPRLNPQKRLYIGGDPQVTQMMQVFETQTGKESVSQTLAINDRSYYVRGLAGKSVWFEFKDICDIYVSASDYLALSRGYLTWFISGVPFFSEETQDQAKRFQVLIDILYEKKVQLWLQCAGEIEELNQLHSERFQFSFQRTESRLIEMIS